MPGRLWTDAPAADFGRWLEDQRDVVLRYSDAVFVAVGVEGTVWMWHGRAREVQQALHDLAASRVKLWSADPGTPKRVNGLCRDLAVAAQTVWPGRPVAVIADLDPSVRRPDDAGDGWQDLAAEQLGMSDARARSWWVDSARLGADVVDGVRRSSSREVTAAVERDARLHRVWGGRGEAGYRIDLGRLTHEKAAGPRAAQESMARWGVDLTLTNRQTLGWLARRGIVCRGDDGQLTVARYAWATAHVPPSAVEDWAAFQAIREAAAAEAKLGELARFGGSGRFSATIRVNAGRTGRMTITQPALQNLTPSQRELLLAEPDHALVGLDLDRVEPRIAAALSGDRRLAQACEGDLYAALAAQLGGGTTRKAAKTAFLALIYGQGSAGLAAKLGVSVAGAKSLRQRVRETYPIMSRWARGLVAAAEAGEGLRTAYGRPLAVPHAPFAAVNYVVQGTAADVLKAMTERAVDALGPAAMWLSIHDELVVQVPVDAAGEASEALTTAMSLDLDGVHLSGSATVLGARFRKA